MNAQEFIESGLLEAYIAGFCSVAERKEVERMRAKHPELRVELNAIETALEKLALAQAVAPASGLKTTIIDAVVSSRKTGSKPDPTAPSDKGWPPL